MYDSEHQLRLDSKAKEEAAVERQEELAALLTRQTRLKEMFEDKLRDTLDVNFRIGKDHNIELTKEKRMGKKPGKEEIRQRQIKRVLEGFNVELKGYLIQQQQKVSKTYNSVFDLNYG